MLLDESFFEQFIGSSFFKVLSLFSITNVQNYNFVVSGANFASGILFFLVVFRLFFFFAHLTVAKAVYIFEIMIGLNKS